MSSKIISLLFIFAIPEVNLTGRLLTGIREHVNPLSFTVPSIFLSLIVTSESKEPVKSLNPESKVLPLLIIKFDSIISITSFILKFFVETFK